MAGFLAYEKFSVMFVYLFVVKRPDREYFAHMETSPLLLQSQTKVWNLRPLRGRGAGLYRATPGVTIGIGVCGFIRRTDRNLVAYSYLDPNWMFSHEVFLPMELYIYFYYIFTFKSVK